MNPLDFFRWSEVERGMALHKHKVKETMTAFKARLPRVALSITCDVVKKAVAGMKKRAQAIYDAKGHDIEIN